MARERHSLHPDIIKRPKRAEDRPCSIITMPEAAPHAAETIRVFKAITPYP